MIALGGSIFGQDRDALFPFEVAGVEHGFLRLTAFVQCPGLPQHGVDRRRLAVVDVGDDWPRCGTARR